MSAAHHVVIVSPFHLLFCFKSARQLESADAILFLFKWEWSSSDGKGDIETNYLHTSYRDAVFTEM